MPISRSRGVPKRWRSGPAVVGGERCRRSVAPANALSTGSHCPCARQRGVEVAQRHAGADRRGQVAVAVDEQVAEQTRRGQHQIDARRPAGPSPACVPPPRITVVDRRPAAVGERGGAGRGASSGSATRPRHHAVDGVAGRARSAIVRRRSSEALGEPGAARRDAGDTGRAPRRTAAASAAPCRDCRGAADRSASRSCCIASRSCVGEHARHVVALVGADAVLAGDRAAGLDAVGQDLAGDFLGQLAPAPAPTRRSRSADAGCRRRRGTRCRCAGPVRSDSARMRAEHFGQLRPRHDAVLHVVVRRDAAHRRERRLASLPDPRALLVVGRHFDDGRAGAPADRLDRREELAHLRHAGRRARRSGWCRPAESSGARRLRRRDAPARPSSPRPPG